MKVWPNWTPFHRSTSLYVFSHVAIMYLIEQPGQFSFNRFSYHTVRSLLLTTLDTMDMSKEGHRSLEYHFWL